MNLRAVLVASEKRESSFTGEASEALPRRNNERRSLRLGAVTHFKSAGDVRVIIRDISKSGLLMEAEHDVLSTEDIVEVSLPEQGTVTARVAWQSGRFFGCQFNEPISAGAISAALLKSDPEATQDTPVADTEAEAPSRGRRPTIYPELNFSVALVLTLVLWAILGAIAYFFVA